MNNKGKQILEEMKGRSGMTVPEGYFASFAENMIATLPANPAAEQPRVLQPLGKRSLWQRVRPYAYMAAMFAGIWCTMKVFTLMRPSNVDLGFETNKVLTEALSDDNFIYDYISTDINENEYLDELYDEGVDVDAIITDDAPLYDDSFTTDDSI